METSSSAVEAAPSNSAAGEADLLPEPAKLFVGGIREGLNEEEIRDYFGRFGEVKEVVVVKDKATGGVRGFGFVEFLDPDSAEKALGNKEHDIGNFKVDVKRARPRGEQRRNYQSSQYQYSGHRENRGVSNSGANNYCNSVNPTSFKKIFVGGLSSTITEDEFRGYFEKFGRITDVVIMYDSSTHRPRGFGFITFDSVEAIDSVLQEKFHKLNNKTVEVKLAVPKDSNNQSNCSESNGVGRRATPINNHQRVYVPPYNPRYGLYPGYAVPPIPGFLYGTTGYVGGYGVGPYGGISYAPPFLARSPWSGPGMMGGRRSPVPYGPPYTGYINAGFGGYTSTGAYGWSGSTDKLNHMDNDVSLPDHNTGTEDVGIEKLDIQQAS